MKAQIRKILLSAVFGSVLCGCLCVKNAMAELDIGGWEGMFPGGGASSTGGGAGCNEGPKNIYGVYDYNTWLAECTGTSWIYYEVSDWLKVDGNADKIIYETDKNGNKVIPLSMPFNTYNTARGTNDDLKVYVSGECARYGAGSGLWHYGVNGMGYLRYLGSGKYYTGNWDTSLSQYGGYFRLINEQNQKYVSGTETAGGVKTGAKYYRVDEGKWGHYFTTYVGANDNRDVIEERGNVYQELWGNTTEGYQPLFVASGDAQLYKRDECVSVDGQCINGFVEKYVGVSGSFDSNDEIVLDAFNWMRQLSGNYQSVRLPDGLYSFCYHYKYERNFDTPEFNVESKAQVDGMGDSWHDTGLVSVDKTASPSAADKTVKVGEQVKIHFKHSAVSSIYQSNVFYSFESIGFDTAGVVVVAGTAANGNDELGNHFTNLTNGKYTINAGSNVIRDSTYVLSFSNTGTYELCEQAKLPIKLGSSIATVPAITTKACVKIKVENQTDKYAGQSIVRINGNDSYKVDTGIVETATDKDTAEYTGRVGENVSIAFVHKGFSSKSKDSVSWSVTDTPTADSTKYDISRSGKTVGANDSGNAKFATENGGWYTTSNLIVDEDLFGITFKKTGTYSFCETLNVAGSKKTKVCAKVKIVGGNEGYAGQSSVSSGGSATSTNKVSNNSSRASVTKDLGTINEGESVSFSFRHSAWARPMGQTASWTVKSTGNFSSSLVQVTSGSTANKNGSIRASYSPILIDGDIFLAGNVLTAVVASQDFTVKINSTGEYKFCQELTVGGYNLSEACVKVKVEGGPGGDPQCGASAENVTAVDSYVTNDNTGMSGKNVYAKPGDSVTWHECYYGGVQMDASKPVTKVHAWPTHPSSGVSPLASTNTNVPVSDMVGAGWGNGWTAMYPDGTNGSGSYSVGSVQYVTPTKTIAVGTGNVGSYMNDQITSTSPVSVSFTNYGIHTWNCNPTSSSNNNGVVYRSDWVETDEDVCNGTWETHYYDKEVPVTELYCAKSLADDGYRLKNGKCYKNLKEKASENFVCTHLEGTGWVYNSTTKKCERKVKHDATPNGYECINGWLGPVDLITTPYCYKDKKADLTYECIQNTGDPTWTLDGKKCKASKAANKDCPSVTGETWSLSNGICNGMKLANSTTSSHYCDSSDGYTWTLSGSTCSRTELTTNGLNLCGGNTYFTEVCGSSCCPGPNARDKDKNPPGQTRSYAPTCSSGSVTSWTIMGVTFYGCSISTTKPASGGVTTYSCDAGWGNPFDFAYGKWCSKTQAPTRSCNAGWTGPDSNNNCSKSKNATVKTATCDTANGYTWGPDPDNDYNCRNWNNDNRRRKYKCSNTSWTGPTEVDGGYFCYEEQEGAAKLKDRTCDTSHGWFGPVLWGTSYICSKDDYQEAKVRNVGTCDGLSPYNTLGLNSDYSAYICKTSGGATRAAKDVTTTEPDYSRPYSICRRTDGSVGTDKKKVWQAVEWYQTCSHTNDYIEYSLNNGPVSAYSTVWIPYNYNLRASVELGAGYIYAGEKMTVNSGKINVETRYNTVTQGSYATVARNVSAKLIAYVSTYDRSSVGGTEVSTSDMCAAVGNNAKQCTTLQSLTGMTLNSNSTLTGTSENKFGGTYNAFDASAGDYICFAIGVYPSSSGYDTNLSDTNGSGMWYLSNSSCKPVAKKPLFHVYGAGVYSAGDAEAMMSSKYNLYGGTYSANGGSHRVFGSWIEQNFILGGYTNSVASGASTAGGIVENGSGTSGFCRYRAPLSFANFGSLGGVCYAVLTGGKAGGMGGTTGSTYGVMANRSNYVTYWLPETTTANISAGATISVANSYNTLTSPSGESVRYSLADGNLTLSAATVPASTTHIVRTRSGGNIYISGNLTYAGGNYAAISQIPKLVIYGNNIYIDCSVTRIDAILIANGTINTCYNGGGVDDSARSNQLIINGVTISDKLELGRTYGAATGLEYSDVPAEIINYDSSAILWGRYMSGSGESGDLTMTYTHELAPRY